MMLSQALKIARRLRALDRSIDALWDTLDRNEVRVKTAWGRFGEEIDRMERDEREQRSYLEDEIDRLRRSRS